jgi:hypothetical protein
MTKQTYNEFAKGRMMKPKEGAIFTVSRGQVKNKREPDRTHVVFVNDIEGNLIFWAGPMNIFERDKTLITYRNHRNP